EAAAHGRDLREGDRRGGPQERREEGGRRRQARQRGRRAAGRDRHVTESLYLDANASAPPLPEALEALVAAARIGANPSSPHARGREARRLLDEARRHVARALGGRDKDVLFTSGAS